MTNIVKRLRDAHPQSPQYFNGSMLLAEAADRIEALESAMLELSNKCQGELGCPGYRLAYSMALCLPRTAAKSGVENV